MKRFFALALFTILCWCPAIIAQNILQWSTINGNSCYYESDKSGISRTELPAKVRTLIAKDSDLMVAQLGRSLAVEQIVVSPDESKILIYTNSKRVWRRNTRGDYWLYDTKTRELKQLGRTMPESSMMFAKFSPDFQRVAYVSQNNLYVEDLKNGKIKQLTKDGTVQIINGTFDWVYEEEFDCRDGFRWSPDGQNIAYWQIDARKTRNFLMINNTDSIYPFTVPIQYPKVGEPPSPFRIGVVSINSAKTKWVPLAVDAANSYLPRMEWVPNTASLLLQHVNRKQNNTVIYRYDLRDNSVHAIYKEQNDAWIDMPEQREEGCWHWLNQGKEFLILSEKSNWRHIYKIGVNGGEKPVTSGNFDIIDLLAVDENNSNVYAYTSDSGYLCQYLRAFKLDGSGGVFYNKNQKGTHRYSISPDGKYAKHGFSNYYTKPVSEWVSLPAHTPLPNQKSLADQIVVPANANDAVFSTVTTEDGLTMDYWLVKPKNFDPTKKYPIVFKVYGEPASTTVKNTWNVASSLYGGDLAEDGYIYCAIEGRGTPAPKGSAWRKSIYRNIGRLNIKDQAMGAKALFKEFSWIDTSRVAVWGWSGGGATTLNLLFQYPDIYKTGIAIAAITNQFTYDNIYQERYMGLKSENPNDFIAGSPVTYAKNLKGNLLYIHGTGDDNVHYQNSEILQNELIKHNKYFNIMPYPNRSHGIFEGENTSNHLRMLFTRYLRDHCPPGGRTVISTP